MRFVVAFVMVVVTVGLGGCGVATHVRPTPPRTVTVEASAGGPVAMLGGVPIPLPLATVGGSYGVDEGLDVQAHVHVTTALALRVPGFDVGATWMPIVQKRARPAVAFTGRLYAFSDFRTGTWPFGEVSAAASWLVGERYLSYVTVGGLVDFVDGYVHWSPGVGEQITFGRFSLGLEARWYDPGYSTAGASVPWVNVGGLGAWGLVLGLNYRLGGNSD